MKGNKHMKTITNITYPALALFTLACFAVSQPARAVCQEGCDLNGAGTTVLGDNALVNNNTADGVFALQNNTTGSNNIALGNNVGFNLTTGSNNIDIGNAGVAGESARIRIGTRQIHRNTFIAGISGVTVPTGIAVIID